MLAAPLLVLAGDGWYWGGLVLGDLGFVLVYLGLD